MSRLLTRFLALLLVGPAPALARPQDPGLPEIAAKLRSATDREHYEAGAVDAAKALAGLRSPEAMALRLELFDARWSSYRGVFLRDWFYAGMRRSETREEGDHLARAAAERKHSEPLRLLCLRAIEACAAPVDGELLFDEVFLRAPAAVQRAWQAAAGRCLADGRAEFAQPEAAAKARAALVEAGPPYLGHAFLPDWTEAEWKAVQQAAWRAKEPPDRAEALRVLATRHDRQDPFVAAAAAALKAKDRAPRAAALHAAAEGDAYEAVPVLVEFLARVAEEEQGRWAWDAADALRLLTGMPLGVKPELWASWWRSEGQAWLEERRAGGARPHVGDGVARQNESATVSVGFFGLPVDSTRVAIVVDGSGSMATSKIGALGTVEAAAREVRAFCEQLPDGAVFQLWIIEQQPFSCFKKALPVTGSNRRAAEQFLRERAYRSTSAVVEALEAAMLDPAIDTIVLVGDGGSSAGLHTYDEHVLEAAKRLHARHGVRIHTVLVTDNEAHKDLMEGLARVTGGRMARPAHSD